MMIDEVNAAVLRINTESAQGSGFIFETTAGGGAYVITNFHVIEGADLVEVRVEEADSYTATVLGYDAQKDLAVLEICCGDFKALSLQDSHQIEVGAEVIAIGYSLGIAGAPTVTRGIVSAHRYDDSYQSWIIQTDASIHPGNSGGPLLLYNGEVAGVSSFIIRNRKGVSIDGVGFAISRESIQESLPSLKKGERTALPTPTPWPTLPGPTSDWGTYTDPYSGYTIEVPGDWTVDSSGEDRLDLLSPGEYAAVHFFHYDSENPSLEAWVLDTIAHLRKYHEDLFEITAQRIKENEDGTGVAAVVYRARTSPEYCTTLRNHVFLVSEDSGLIIETRVCEELEEMYVPVLERIVKSFFQN